MASTEGKNASLFGDDSDSSSSSSDESVGRRKATEPAVMTSTKEEGDKATSKEGGNDGDDGDGGEAAPTTATSAAKENDGDEDGDGDDDKNKEKNAETNLDGKDKDKDKHQDKDKDTEQDKEKDIGMADKGKHASLFGDDDDSSDDDEFDGDDGIVGRSTGSGAAAASAAGGTPAVDPAPRTMNQTLGLDSDSDDDHKRAIAEEKEQQKKKEAETPRYRPARRMELLSLTEEETKRENVFHVAKLPNLVGINSTPYDKRSHDKEAEEEQYRGYVHNMIRWRYRYRNDGGDGDERELLRDDQGNPVRESNTRLVKWSDGSYTLHVGTEVLEVDSLDSSVPWTAAAPTTGAPGATRPLPGFAGINGYVYVSQKAKIRPPSRRELAKARNGGILPENEHLPSSSDEEDENETDAKPAGTILECLGPIASRFAPRPSSLASEAHRNLTLAVRQRNVKRARIAEIVTEVDPEQEKLARIKGKDDLEKSRRGKVGRRGGGGRRSHGRGMNATYLEEDGDYDGVNLGKLKRQTMRREVYSDEEDADMDYGEDSEEEEDEWSKKKKRRPNKDAARRGGSDGGKRRGRPEWDDEDEDEEEGELVFGDDDDEGDDAAMFKKRGGGGASKKAVLDDDDD